MVMILLCRVFLLDRPQPAVLGGMRVAGMYFCSIGLSSGLINKF